MPRSTLARRSSRRTSSRIAVLAATVVVLSGTVAPTAAGAADTGARAAQVPVAAQPARAVRLSDLAPVSQVNGWGPVERDRSNGGLRARDGRVLRLNGRTFAKGLGVHGRSDVRYRVPVGCTRFDAVVGVDDEVVVDGSVTFTVAQGSTTLFRSGVRRHSSANLAVSVPVVAGRELRLLVSDGGNGPSNDHADWADARLTCRSGATAAPARSTPRTVTPPSVARPVPPGRCARVGTSVRRRRCGTRSRPVRGWT
jgi:beta-galactosidase